MMTRKDFVAIAGALALAKATAGSDLVTLGALVHLADELAEILHRSNPSFDAKRFRMATTLPNLESTK